MNTKKEISLTCKRFMTRFLVYFSVFFILISCARQGRPTGGPKDEIPPRFVNAIPDTLAINVSTDLNEIRINFDEYLILKDYTQNIIVSPPFRGNTTYYPIGSPAKFIRIKFSEPLQKNTTYNINFGNAIQDNNEGNKLPYFQYVFSTGDFIDSLEIQGKVIDPFVKKQAKNLMVGLFKVDSAYSDSLILKEKPFYVAKVNEEGKFTLNYLSSGKYQLIAFDDEVQNLQFDIGKEKLGFIETPIELSENQEFNVNIFDQPTEYRTRKAEQRAYGHLVFLFSGQAENIQIQPLDFDFNTSKISYQSKSDSLNFWFNPAIDSIGEKATRLNFLVKHQEQTDTLSVVYNFQTEHKLSITQKKTLEYAPQRPVYFTSNYPINHLDSSKFTVFKDSVQLPVQIIPDEKNNHRFSLNFPIELNSNYKIELNPGAIIDFFNEESDSLQFGVQTRTKNEFGHLYLKLENKPKTPFWIQLLNDKNEILDEKYSTDSKFEYPYLLSGNYYFRILVDENENEFWDTGDFFTKKQAENVYIYPTFINVRPLWDMDETWILPQEDNENGSIDDEELL
ncbi:MAG: Ig-like domain-containing protein [Weeksellaceae bacterium]|nr:Ig-like domain-containing protein [Weeksellaceae bacterium]